MDTIYFALLDKYGNIVSIDTDSKLYLSVVQNSSNKFPSTFETSTTFTVKNGAFELKDIVFVSTPDTT